MESRYADTLAQGRAAEHFVCADLLRQGVEAYLSDQGLSYDVVADLDGQLLRIQVKSTLGFRNVSKSENHVRDVYRFSPRRIGKNGQSRLTNRDADIFAFVALDIMAVAYVAVWDVKMTVDLMPPDHDFENNYRRKYMKPITDMPFSAAVSDWKAGSHGTD